VLCIVWPPLSWPPSASPLLSPLHLLNPLSDHHDILLAGFLLRSALLSSLSGFSGFIHLASVSVQSLLASRDIAIFSSDAFAVKRIPLDSLDEPGKDLLHSSLGYYDAQWLLCVSLVYVSFQPPSLFWLVSLCGRASVYGCGVS
jgi:hypothetical protein